MSTLDPKSINRVRSEAKQGETSHKSEATISSHSLRRGPKDYKYGDMWVRQRDYRPRRRYPKPDALNPRVVGDVAYVQLNDGAEAVIDVKDVPIVSGRVWHLAESNKGVFYAVSNNPRVRMHRLILGAKPGQLVDHADGDGLNNRRENIRICTTSQNACNARKPSHGKTAQFKGVCLVSGLRRKKYRASKKADGRAIHLGYFLTPEAAALAYDAAARQHFGSFARLNCPEATHASITPAPEVGSC